MASPVQWGNRYCVIYTYENNAGAEKQKLEPFPTKADALYRKAEIEYRSSIGSVIVP